MGSITENGLYQVDRTEKSAIVSEGENFLGSSPSMVVFPRQIIDLPPLKLEVEDSSEDMNPRNMWQVYALGGFMLAKWIWARWKERRGNSQEDPLLRVARALLFDDSVVSQLAAPFALTLVVLFGLASICGKPLQTDQATASISRPSIARVLVELDVSKKHPTEVWLHPHLRKVNVGSKPSQNKIDVPSDNENLLHATSNGKDILDMAENNGIISKSNDVPLTLDVNNSLNNKIDPLPIVNPAPITPPSSIDDSLSKQVDRSVNEVVVPTVDIRLEHQGLNDEVSLNILNPVSSTLNYSLNAILPTNVDDGLCSKQKLVPASSNFQILSVDLVEVEVLEEGELSHKGNGRGENPECKSPTFSTMRYHNLTDTEDLEFSAKCFARDDLDISFIKGRGKRGSSGRSWIVRDDRYSSVDLIFVRFRSDFCTDLSAVLVLGRARKSRIRFQSLIRLDDYFEEMNSDRCFVPLHLMFLENWKMVNNCESICQNLPSEANFASLREVKSHLCNLQAQEETYWKQKASAKYLVEGDKNTKYFHALVNRKRASNSILKISREDGYVTENGEKFDMLAVHHFKNRLNRIFNPTNLLNPSIIPSIVSENDNDMLACSPSIEELKDIIFNMNGNSVTGPNGFTTNFFQNSWDIIKDDLYETVLDFFTGFVKGRSIYDNILIFQEFCHDLDIKARLPLVPSLFIIDVDYLSSSWDYYKLAEVVTECIIQKILNIPINIDTKDAWFVNYKGHIRNVTSALIFWYLWLERNNSVFKGIKMDSARIDYSQVHSDGNACARWLARFGAGFDGFKDFVEANSHSPLRGFLNLDIISFPYLLSSSFARWGAGGSHQPVAFLRTYGFFNVVLRVEATIPILRVDQFCVVGLLHSFWDLGAVADC
ncbi:hypothetical protein KFK09_008437 [Dendrobium nobile]|uniref:Uncharacterized protein n=1 Tax=Dendrobium nobile TaxID=94219 RepID=A0A8T3BPZ0_DENNO|nr:hypothetical protein KFK09_008437 [Dendrobium nobile]